MAAPILDTIIADINAIVPQYSSVVSSYRLLVGSAEEISRMPGVPREVYERAVCRYDRAGTLIDILHELLCCKIRFLAEFLSVTCAPIDIFSLAQNPLEEVTVEEIIEIEVLRRLLEVIEERGSCFPPREPLKEDCSFPCPPPAPEMNQGDFPRTPPAPEMNDDVRTCPPPAPKESTRPRTPPAPNKKTPRNE